MHVRTIDLLSARGEGWFGVVKKNKGQISFQRMMRVCIAGIIQNRRVYGR